MMENPKLTTAEIEQKRRAKIPNKSPLALQRENVQLKKQVEVDAMTGFLRKEVFIEKLDKVLAAKRGIDNEQVVSVLVIDIDYFKLVNDTAGHPKGDEVLEAVSRVIHEHVRETDLVGRVGGEEFAVCLVGEKGTGAKKAEEIRESIESSITRPDNGKSLTVSIGIAETVGHRGRERLILKADEALYAAKKNGRNRKEIDGWPSDIKKAA